PLFEAAMKEHLGHVFMILHFLLSGCLCFWVVLGGDPGPHQLPYVGRLLLLFVTMRFHRLFGVRLVMMGTLNAPIYDEPLGRIGGGPLVLEQQNGGAVAGGFGESPPLIVLLAIATQWYRSEHRKARRADRTAARTGDPELSSY